MTTTENGIAVNDNSLSINAKKETPTPSLIEDESNSRKRNVEDFLKLPEMNDEKDKSSDPQNVIPAIDGSSHLKTPTSPLSNVENDKKMPNIKEHISVNPETESESVISVSARSISSHHTGKSIPELTRDNGPILPSYDCVVPATVVGDFLNNNALNEVREVATPTIRTVQRNSSNYPKKPDDFRKFTDQLNELAKALQQKDDEIKKLSEKLLALENKESKPKRKADTKSSKPSSSSSSSSSSESSNKTDVTESKKKSNTTKDKETVKENKLTKSKEENKNPKKDKEPPKEKKPSKNKEEKKSDQEDENERKIKQEPVVKNEPIDVSDLILKLSYLENEVRRLQQINADATLVSNKITSREARIENETLSRIMKDHSLLKEKIEDLKSEQSKLTHFVPLEDEVKKLKDDVNKLRNQNELLQRYVKTSSSKDLNDVPKNENKKNSYGGKLQAPYKSPHSSGRPLTQASAPFNDGKTFRTRKLSDSSSVLMEDVTRKVLVEPIKCQATFRQRSSYLNNKYSERGRNYIDSGASDNSSESYIRDDVWGYKSAGRDRLQTDFDLVSTSDSETIDYSVDKDYVKRRPIYSDAFSPKSARDLSLDDLIEFEKPNGKMSIGHLCFVGHLPGRRELCVGLELEEESGSHDGVFEGKRYFQCRKNRGVFISFHKIVSAYKCL